MTPNWLLRKNFFGKKASWSSSEKNSKVDVLLFFFEYYQTHGATYMGAQGVLTFFV